MWQFYYCLTMGVLGLFFALGQFFNKRDKEETGEKWTALSFLITLLLWIMGVYGYQFMYDAHPNTLLFVAIVVLLTNSFSQFLYAVITKKQHGYSFYLGVKTLSFSIFYFFVSVNYGISYIW